MNNTYHHNTSIRNARGFTLLGLLVSLALSMLVSVAGLEFYMSMHNQSIAQQNISDMQHTLRTSLDDITHQLKNAGANLPQGVLYILASNSNPDTLGMRFAPMGASVSIGEHTLIQQANPIHITKGTDMTKFTVGQPAYLWHASLNTGEWFTVTNIQFNNGNGWLEISHLGQDLLFAPIPGDFVIAMQESRYFIDKADSTHPVLMRSQNGAAAQIFADFVSDLQVSFIRSQGDTVMVPTANDTVYVARISLISQTEQRDVEYEKFGHDGRRYRTLATEVLLRNRRFSS